MLDAMKGAANHLTPGEKMAYYRRRRGLSQSVLADLVGKTTSWVEKIEAGRANLQMLPNIARVAEVLDISPLELMPDDIVAVDATTRGRSVPALRKQLLSYRFVNPRYLATEVEPPALPELTRAVAAAWSGYQASRFGYVVAELHRLLPLAVAAAEIDGSAQVQLRVPVPAGRQCADEGRRAGPRLHLRRPRRPSRPEQPRPGRPRIGAADHRPRAACPTLSTTTPSRSIDQTLGLVPGDPATPELLSAVGTTHLVGAMVSARSGDRPRCRCPSSARSAGRRAVAPRRQLPLDRVRARPTWPSTRLPWPPSSATTSTPAHLGVQVDPAPLPMERQVRHRLEVARALHYQRQQRDALGLVLEAEARAPEQVRRHFLTHALVHDWVRSRHIAANAAAERTGHARGRPRRLSRTLAA